MLLPYLSLVIGLPAVAAIGQVPIIEGVVGGVSNLTHAPESEVLSAAVVTTPGKLRVVENSGVCEHLASASPTIAIDGVIETLNPRFWFFASRKNPDTAPLALWFNGGPGSSSMIGLIQEHGPCRIKNDSSSVTLNPYSWNNEANVLYIDQPVGVGFSHGDLKVSTSKQAAADVWTFLQIFLKDSRFSKYQANNLAIWTESYGGHYGPAFSAYILAQNAAIAAGTLQGLPLNLKVLGIGNGLTVYYVPAMNPDPYPADISNYLKSVASKIGAEATWQITNRNVYSNFASTGGYKV
ncbi:hypothetical protein H0H81_008590 [Sphagnurus paluster]|uniref:Carboxypeptidase n=1 Tax=Sphagnurus paluster TaxID=117069 RepID=A0A9P7GKI5_9AGAR|nr:hypothetical protein H0H81_008590 [Sphagnurus paluster]